MRGEGDVLGYIYGIVLEKWHGMLIEIGVQ